MRESTRRCDVPPNSNPGKERSKMQKSDKYLCRRIFRVTQFTLILAKSNTEQRVLSADFEPYDYRGFCHWYS